VNGDGVRTKPVKPKIEKEDDWPPKRDGHEWKNRTESGVSLYLKRGMKRSANGKPMKDLKYVGHFTWAYLEELYGKERAAINGSRRVRGRA
jgi:hypothetical protein